MCELVITPDERAGIDKIISSAELSDSVYIASFGIGAQRKLAEYSDMVLRTVCSQSSDEIPEQLDRLLDLIQSVGTLPQNQGGLLDKVFGITARRTRKLRRRFAALSVQIDSTEGALEKSRMMLLMNAEKYNMMSVENQKHYRELTLYIKAGKEIINSYQNNIVPSMKQNADSSGDPMKLQQIKALQGNIQRFSERMHELETSSVIALSAVPQLHILADADSVLAGKIQSAVLNTIPVWKNQCSLAFGLDKQRGVINSQRAVTARTSEMLRSNAAVLKENAAETAMAADLGRTDTQTLQKITNNLIATINETLTIQRSGRENFSAAQSELSRIETELKAALS